MIGRTIFQCILEQFVALPIRMDCASEAKPQTNVGLSVLTLFVGTHGGRQ